MTKYGMVYENNNGKIVCVASFVGKNHFKIKFKIYRLIRENHNFSTSPIVFGIHEFRKNIIYVYVGETQKVDNSKTTISRVYGATQNQCDDFTKKLEALKKIPYVSKYKFREEYDDEELSMSESDSELDDDLELDDLSIHESDPESDDKLDF